MPDLTLNIHHEGEITLPGELSNSTRSRHVSAMQRKDKIEALRCGRLVSRLRKRYVRTVKMGDK